MRTTVNLPDDVYEVARRRAFERRISLGQALAEMVREKATANEPEIEIAFDRSFPYVKASSAATRITTEQVLAIQKETE